MGNHFCVTVFLRVNFPVSPQLDCPQVDGLWRRKWQRASFELDARSDPVLGSLGIFPVGAVALGAVGAGRELGGSRGRSLPNSSVIHRNRVVEQLSSGLTVSRKRRGLSSRVQRRSSLSGVHLERTFIYLALVPSALALNIDFCCKSQIKLLRSPRGAPCALFQGLSCSGFPHSWMAVPSWEFPPTLDRAFSLPVGAFAPSCSRSPLQLADSGAWSQRWSRPAGTHQTLIPLRPSWVRLPRAPC